MITLNGSDEAEVKGAQKYMLHKANLGTCGLASKLAWRTDLKGSYERK